MPLLLADVYGLAKVCALLSVLYFTRRRHDSNDGVVRGLFTRRSVR